MNLVTILNPPLPFTAMISLLVYFRIIAGDVTSTVLYCWMAAIVEQQPGDKNKFVCTGTLVKQDLIITSASCTHRLGPPYNCWYAEKAIA